MIGKSTLSKKSIIDFSYMFISNLFKKIFGFLREMILAYFFGSSIVYANFLLLRTVTDFFSQFTFGNALQANLLPKFTKVYENQESVDLSEVYNFTSRFSIKLFWISQVLQLSMIWYINPENKLLYFLLSIILAVLVSTNFFNSVFLIIFQAKGEFKRYSISTTLNLFVATVVLYPLSLFLDLIGVVLSRFIGIITLTFGYIKPLFQEKGEKKVRLSISDFNLSIIFLGNLANIIILTGRFSAGVDGSANITYFTYSAVLLNTLLTAVIMNINTLVLKVITVNKELGLVFISTIISFFVGILLLLFVNKYDSEIISVIFERGAFSSGDTVNTVFYLRSLSWSFILMFIATSLIQPFFTLKKQILKSEGQNLAFFFLGLVIVSIILLKYFNIVQRSIPIYLMFYMSFSYFLISVISLIRYRNHEG